jgi:hypothetical protein
MNITFILVLISVILHLIFSSCPSSVNPASQPFVKPSLSFAFLVIDSRCLAHTCANLRKATAQLQSSYSSTCAYLRDSAQTRVSLRRLARTRGSPSCIPRACLLRRTALGLVYLAGYASSTCRLEMTFISPFDLLSTPRHPFSARHVYRTSYPWLFVQRQR